MLNCVYRLVSPRTIESVVTDVALGSDAVVVRPTHLSICNADQRYYQGRRPAHVMKQKLPMALIHEGIGRVVYDARGVLASGERVVMLPNNAVEHDAFIAENYLTSSQFCGSGYDGFMQEMCVLPARRVLALPEGIDLQVGAFTELVSVVVHAIARFDAIAHGRRDTVGVWGDGNVGFITALVLHTMYPNMNVVVFGRNPYKLADFTFTETYLTSEAHHAPVVDHAFECCGGEGAVSAIDQIIDTIRPEGTIALLGVSESHVPINTRMLLEKGLRMIGSSRSGRADFESTIALFQQHPQVADYLHALVNSVIEVSSIKDMNEAFEADARKPMGKTVLEWHV